MHLFFKRSPWVCTCAGALVLLASQACGAQTLTELKLRSTSISAGQQAQAVLNFVLQEGVTQCGMRMHWGDGAQEDVKISEDKDVPLLIAHRYEKPGTYRCISGCASSAPVFVFPDVEEN